MKSSYQQPTPTCQSYSQANFEAILYPQSSFQMIATPANVNKTHQKKKQNKILSQRSQPIPLKLSEDKCLLLS